MISLPEWAGPADTLNMDSHSRSHVSRRPGVMQKQLAYIREQTEPNLVKVTIPTLPYEAFDCSGEKILPWSLLKLFDSCEVGDFWHNKDDKHGPSQDQVLFMLNCELEVDRALYEWESPKFPLVIDNRLVFVKRSSRAFENLLFHPERSKPYARFFTIDVNMDPQTRKPKPLPEWWKEHFRSPSDGDRREYELPPKPKEGVFSSSCRIHFSDTDENKHANYTSYVRYCFDHMCENIIFGKYGSGLDAYQIGLKKLQVTFLNECMLGDVLTIHSWQTDSSENRFCFEIWNSTKMAATMSMELYNLLSKIGSSNL